MTPEDRAVLRERHTTPGGTHPGCMDIDHCKVVALLDALDAADDERDSDFNDYKMQKYRLDRAEADLREARAALVDADATMTGAKWFHWKNRNAAAIAKARP